MKKPKFNVPDMKYAAAEDTAKKMISLRLPDDLVKRLKEIASDKGWNLTVLVQIVLDQYAQYEDEK